MTETLFCQSDLYFSQGPVWLCWALSHVESLIWKIVEMFINCSSVPDVCRRPRCSRCACNLLTAIKLHLHSDKSVYLGGDSQLETSISSIFVLRIENVSTKRKKIESQLHPDLDLLYHLKFDSIMVLTSWVSFSWCVTDLSLLEGFEDATAYLTESISYWTKCQLLFTAGVNSACWKTFSCLCSSFDEVSVLVQRHQTMKDGEMGSYFVFYKWLMLPFDKHPETGAFHLLLCFEFWIVCFHSIFSKCVCWFNC